MNISKRKIMMFRCYHDPMIGPKPRQAFSLKECPTWDMELTPVGVYVKWPELANGKMVREHEHMVPFANVQSIKFAEESDADKKAA